MEIAPQRPIVCGVGKCVGGGMRVIERGNSISASLNNCSNIETKRAFSLFNLSSKSHLAEALNLFIYCVTSKISCYFFGCFFYEI